MNSYLDTLCGEIRKVCTAEQYAWFDAALDKLQSGDGPSDQLATLITQVRRNIGNELLSGTSSPLDTAAGPLHTNRWSATDAARIALLLSLIASKPDETENIVNHIYKLGDEAEHVSIIKGLALYSENDSLKPVALEAGHTNSHSLFAALALNNPYPAAYYSELEFNQMVLKALFTGLNIDAVQDLQQRANQELSRMAEDYLEEREAAGRGIPVAIWLALAPYRSAQGEKLLIAALGDVNAGHRYYSAKAITTLRGAINPEFRDALAARLETETDDRIREVLRGALVN